MRDPSVTYRRLSDAELRRLEEKHGVPGAGNCYRNLQRLLTPRTVAGEHLGDLPALEIYALCLYLPFPGFHDFTRDMARRALAQLDALIRARLDAEPGTWGSDIPIQLIELRPVLQTYLRYCDAMAEKWTQGLEADRAKSLARKAAKVAKAQAAPVAVPA